jgi:cytochrome c-type biogenesis protein CcmH
MILWIVSTALTSLVMVLVAVPFILRLAVRRSIAALEEKAVADRSQHSRSAGAPAAGETDEARAAPIESKRPIPADGNASGPPGRGIPNSRLIWTAATSSAVVVLGILGLYALMRDEPIATDPSTASISLPVLARAPVSPRNNVQLLPKSPSAADQWLDQVATTVPPVQSAPKAASGLPPVDELIERLVARLRQNPKDIGGWRTLGWSYFNLQRYDDAEAAYAKCIELNPDIADCYSARGETLVRAANGTVTAESRQAFANALRLDLKDLRARYYEGLAKAQAGDKAAALDAWIGIANDGGTIDPALPDLGKRIAELAKELDVDVTQRLQQPLAAARSREPDPSNEAVGSTPPAAAPSESRPDIAGAPAQEDQAAMIRGMVERLASRLDASPRDVDGWIRLIRSRQVLKEQEAAKQALDRALKVFNDPSPERERLVAAAKGLGLSP